MNKNNIQSQCSPAQWQLIERFVELLLAHNKKVNLISRQEDAAAVYERHVAPSFLFVTLERLRVGERILDIGSGGGFPGIINAILLPDSEFVLVDSTRKKVEFLQHVITELDLRNAQAIWSRVEDLAKSPQWSQAFDHTTSRAVAPLKKLVAWSKPLLKSGGTVEALKGGNIAAELKALSEPYSLHRLPTTANTQYSTYLQHACIVSVQ